MNGMDVGDLIIERRWIEGAFGNRYTEITSVRLEGPPLVVFDERVLSELPIASIATDGDTIQIGPYLLRRTADFNPAFLGHYWIVIGQGELYWLRWRTMQLLDRVWRRIILTLAVWRLAEWPQYGCYPTWDDVVRRWRK